MLAHPWKDESIAGWYMSVKLDGMRAVWVPWTRDIDCSKISFADDKGIATGLWSRYAKIIHAPDWFLDDLPDRMLDGELYLGVGKFEETMSILRRKKPDDRWQSIHYSVFDLPWNVIFQTKRRESGIIVPEVRPISFEKVREIVEPGQYHSALEQVQLPVNDTAVEVVLEKLDEVVSQGGEGVMVRKPGSIWTPIRSRDLLKVKPFNDAEAVVIGHNPGKGRNEGRLGSLRVKYGETEFDLSGFTDAQRDNAITEFPVGSVVTFRYRELTASGVPKEARFWRNVQA